MLESLVTSKTRIQILIRLFMNPERQAYLRELSAELGESTNGVRVELERLKKAKLLVSSCTGRTKHYYANSGHPLFPEIQSIVKKTLGIDKLLEEVVERLGDIRMAFIVGDYAKGIDSGIIDLVLVGKIDHEYLNCLVSKVEPKIGKRKIRSLVLDEDEYENLAGKLFDVKNKPLILYRSPESKVKQ